MRHALTILLLALLPAVAAAQAPVEPQPGLHTMIELEIRLKGTPTATQPSPTVRLRKWTPSTIDARTFTLTEPCWNAKSACPQVVTVTAQLYLKLPWATRVNVTRFVLCSGSECLLPAFAPLQAKPGEAFRFSYDRMTAQWTEPPRIVPAP